MPNLLRPRLLPSIMGVGAILLATKLVVLGMVVVWGPAGVSAAMVTPAAAATPPEKVSPTTPPIAPVPVAGSRPALPPQPVEPSLASSPATVSDAERQLLQDLRSRRQELDARERILAQREGVLDAAEQRLNARVAQLSELQSKLEQLEAQRQQHAEENWAGLVKVYETMKPRDAATIFNDMEMPVLLQVIDRMKETKVAPILAAMQPDRARLVTTQLAGLRTRALDFQPPHQNPG